MSDPIIVNSQTLEKTFDESASLYDEGGVFRESGQRLVDLLDLKPGMRVLDIATGAGAVLLPAARRVGITGQATGIDISANLLARTRQTAIQENLSNIKLLKLDGGQLLFTDEPFDVVTCGFGIFFLPAAGLDEMYRVCKPGGMIGLTVFDKTVVQNESPGQVFWQLTKEYGIEVKYSMPLPASYTPEEVRSLVASHGLKKIETVQESKETVSVSLEDYWRIILSGGNRTVVMSMDKAMRSRFKNDLFDRLMSIKKPDGIHSLFAVIYLTGHTGTSES